MRISTMLILISAALMLGGVGSRTLSAHGIGRRCALFFLLAVAVLDRYTLYPADDIAVSPACIIAAAWLFGNAFAQGSGARLPAASLPYSIALGFATAPLAASGGEWACYAAGLAPALLTLPLGIGHGLSAAALTPVFAELVCFAGAAPSAAAALELTEYCLSAQLAGIMLSCAFAILKERRRTTVRILSAERTKTGGRSSVL